MASADSSAPRRAGAWWWCLIPLLTLGLLSGVMVLIAGVRLRHQRTQLLAIPYLLVCTGLFSVAPYVGATPRVSTVVIAVLLVANWLGGTLHVFLLQRRPAPEPVPTAGSTVATVPERSPVAPIVGKRLAAGLVIALLVNLPVAIALAATAASPPYSTTEAEVAFFSGLIELPLLLVTFTVGAVLIRQGRGLGHGLLYGAAISTLLWFGPCVVMVGGVSGT